MRALLPSLTQLLTLLLKLPKEDLPEHDSPHSLCGVAGVFLSESRGPGKVTMKALLQKALFPLLCLAAASATLGEMSYLPASCVPVSREKNNRSLKPSLHPLPKHQPVSFLSLGLRGTCGVSQGPGQPPNAPSFRDRWAVASPAEVGEVRGKLSPGLSPAGDLYCGHRLFPSSSGWGIRRQWWLCCRGCITLGDPGSNLMT